MYFSTFIVSYGRQKQLKSCLDNKISSFLRWLALYLSFKSAYRLHHSRLWDEEVQENEAKGRAQLGKLCLSHRDLVLWLNRPTSYPNVHRSPILQVSSIVLVLVLSYDDIFTICLNHHMLVVLKPFEGPTLSKTIKQPFDLRIFWLHFKDH